MTDILKPVGQNKSSIDCKHALMFNYEDKEAIPYWDCVRCGAVAFFDPATQRMFMPRES